MVFGCGLGPAHCAINVRDTCVYNLHVDILGAKNAGMDQVFVNHIGEKHSEDIFREVHSLEELRPIFS